MGASLTSDTSSERAAVIRLPKSLVRYTHPLWTEGHLHVNPPGRQFTEEDPVVNGISMN